MPDHPTSDAELAPVSALAPLGFLPTTVPTSGKALVTDCLI